MRTFRVSTYDFYIRSSGKRRFAYTIIFVVSLLYAVINALLLRRAEASVAIEVAVLTFLMVSLAPVAHEVSGQLQAWLRVREIGSIWRFRVSDWLFAIVDLAAITTILLVLVAYPFYVPPYAEIVAGPSGGSPEAGQYYKDLAMLKTFQWILAIAATYIVIHHFLWLRRMGGGGHRPKQDQNP